MRGRKLERAVSGLVGGMEWELRLLQHEKSGNGLRPSLQLAMAVRPGNQPREGSGGQCQGIQT